MKTSAERRNVDTATVISGEFPSGEQPQDVFQLLLHHFRERVVTAKSLERLAGVTHQQRWNWDNQWTRAWAKAAHPEGWRRYSVKDLIRYAILKALMTQLQAPLKRFKDELVEWVQCQSVLEGLLHPFSRGVGIFMGVELRPDGLGRFWREDDRETPALLFTKARSPVIVLPLNPIFEKILSGYRTDDFQAKRNPDGTWSFCIKSRWIDPDTYLFRFRDVETRGNTSSPST